MTKMDGFRTLSTTESYRTPGLPGSFVDGGAFIPFPPEVYRPTSTLATYILRQVEFPRNREYLNEYEESTAKYTPSPYATPTLVLK